MGKKDLTAVDYNERERLTKYSEARKDADLPYVTEVYSLCTDDCELGHHVPDFRTCARCGAQIHKRIIEIYHPELGDLIVGSECVNDIMGWKWSTSHEQAWETGIALEQYLDRIKMPAAIMSKYKGGVLLNATMRNDLGVDIFRWDRHLPKSSNPLSRYVSNLHFAAGYVTLPHGFPDRLVRAGQDLGFIWVPLKTGYYLIAARGADYEKPHWVTFNASKPQLAEVRIQGGEAETRDEAAKLAERSVQEHWFKEIDKYDDPQYILSAVYEFRFIEAEPTPVGKQKLPTAHVLVDPDLSRIWNTRTQKLMENPVAKSACPCSKHETNPSEPYRVGNLEVRKYTDKASEPLKFGVWHLVLEQWLISRKKKSDAEDLARYFGQGEGEILLTMAIGGDKEANMEVRRRTLDDDVPHVVKPPPKQRPVTDWIYIPVREGEPLQVPAIKRFGDFVVHHTSNVYNRRKPDGSAWLLGSYTVSYKDGRSLKRDIENRSEAFALAEHVSGPWKKLFDKVLKEEPGAGDKMRQKIENQEYLPESKRLKPSDHSRYSGSVKNPCPCSKINPEPKLPKKVKKPIYPGCLKNIYVHIKGGHPWTCMYCGTQSCSRCAKYYGKSKVDENRTFVCGKCSGGSFYDRKKNPCSCSKGGHHNPTRPDWPVEQCVGCGEDVVLKRPRAGEVLCPSCLKTRRDAQRKSAARNQQQSRQEDERINRQILKCPHCKGFGCSVCDPRLAAASRKNPSGLNWKDYIRGEWWIDEYGESLFADVDIGQAGHEIIAIDAMLDKEILADGVIKHYRAKLRKAKGPEKRFTREKLKAQIEETERHRDNDEMNASQIYLSQEIPEEAGIAAAGSKEAWEDLVRDARMAYAKHKGAILAVNRDFAAWQVTSKTIEGIQGFILEQSGGEEIEDKSTEMCVEEHETQKTVCLPVMEFLTMKHPRDLWALLQPEGNPSLRPWVPLGGAMFVLTSQRMGPGGEYLTAQVGKTASGAWMLWMFVRDTEILNIGASEQGKGALPSLKEVARAVEGILPWDRWNTEARDLLSRWSGEQDRRRLDPKKKTRRSS